LSVANRFVFTQEELLETRERVLDPSSLPTPDSEKELPNSELSTILNDMVTFEVLSSKLSTIQVEELL
jgi:hypothetical protein